MPIAGDRPEAGVRIKIERDKALDDPPWRYAGALHVPEASFPVAVDVDASGEVAVAISPAPDGALPPGDLTEKVRLIVRAVYRQAKAEGEPPAWRIVRWRGDK